MVFNMEDNRILAWLALFERLQMISLGPLVRWLENHCFGERQKH
jgi:hypothetical protein